MPGFITHDLFGSQVQEMDFEYPFREAVEKHHNCYRLGLQGPDLFSYNFFLLIYKDHRNIGSLLHNQRTKAFFEALQKGIANQKTKEARQICEAYICGFFCHYTLDSICHPFVYSRTKFDPQNKSVKYYGRHFQLETDIDATMWKLFQSTPVCSFHPSDILKNLNEKDISVLGSYLSDALEKTYGDLFIKKFFTPGFVKYTISIVKRELAFLYDPTAKKRTFVKSLEAGILHYPLLSSLFVTNQPVKRKDPLNEACKSWSDCWTPEVRSKQSFLELFEESKNEVKRVMPKIGKPIFLENLSDTPYRCGRI